MRVVIEYRETRKPYAWHRAFVATVLYADKDIVLVRGAGSHSTFHGNGFYRGVGMSSSHPAAKLRASKYRIAPRSLVRVFATTGDGS